ncbi:MAG: hypothetical protein ACOY46_10505 [Bacillota bacterium]
MGENVKFRISRMDMSPWDRAILHKKNPWIVMWWSASLPGLGHLCQGSYAKGLTLMSWEILVNFKAKLNLSILYTFTGDFKKAGEVIDAGWALFYGVIFCFAIFDSYRIAVELNLISRIENSEKRRKFIFFKMKTGGVSYLDRSNPWVSAFWSALLPGFGHIYNMKTIKGFIILSWTVAIIYFSHVNNAIIATFTGNFSRAAEMVHYQWLMFFPSIYLFSIWDSYGDSVEMNKIFVEEKIYYLTESYGWKGRSGTRD